MKARKMIGINILDIAIKMAKDAPIASVVRLLKLEGHIHYRSAFDIITADIAGMHHQTRPEWLQPEPMIQKAPVGYCLTGKMGHEDSKWTREVN